MHSPGVNLVHYASVLYAMLATIESKKMLGVFFPPGSPLFLFLWQTKFSNVFTSFPHNHSDGFSNFSPGICWHVLVLVLSNGHFFSILKLLWKFQLDEFRRHWWYWIGQSLHAMCSDISKEVHVRLQSGVSSTIYSLHHQRSWQHRWHVHLWNADWKRKWSDSRVYRV